MKTVFLRVLEADHKATALLRAIREPEWARGRQRFEVSPTSFASVPRSPFAYWVSEKVLQLFAFADPLRHPPRVVVSTNPLNDDFRYVRSWWEVNPSGLHRVWMPWAKGGSYSTVYYDIDTTIRWDGTRMTYAGFLGTENRPLERPASVQHFFRPGLTWPRRTNGLSFRVMPAGCIFADKGPAAFAEDDNADDLLALVSVTSSRAFGLLVSLQLARTELAQSYEVGLIQTTPVPKLTHSDREALAGLARRAWSLKRSLDTRTGTSHAFTLPALLLLVAGADLPSRAAASSEHVRNVDADLAAIQAEIDERCFVLYGVNEADRRAITEGFGPRDSKQVSSEGANEAEDDARDDTDENEPVADATALAADLVSWAVGVAFGRLDVRLATGARPLPAEPEPFDPLPACSPGMLTGLDALPLARPPAAYPLGFPEIGVLVDDRGLAQDLNATIRAVFEVVFGGEADRWWHDVASLLEPKSRDLRIWLSGSFFEHHIKRYSKSRRKSPIYWQLATPSGSYSVWLYAHRLTRDSFFQIQKDVVDLKLAHEERELTRLVQDAGPTPTSQRRKEIAAQETFVAELRAFRDEIARVAPLWNPNLDDGVVITSAPLWRLFPQHKSWQKELKGHWDELCAGKYDWSHLAMHLWPERVVPVCATDRSIAIAHDLEEVFWVEDANGKWKPRSEPTRPIADLIAERTSPAVKAALKSLLEAPVAAAKGKKKK